MVFTNSYVLKSYVKKINKLIKCDKKIKESFIDTLCETISEFSCTHPEFTIKDLYKEFGSPEEISEKLMFNLDDETIFKYEKKKSLIRAVLFVLGCVLVTLAICVLISLIFSATNPPVEFVQSIIH